VLRIGYDPQGSPTQLSPQRRQLLALVNGSKRMEARKSKSVYSQAAALAAAPQ
jgi:hypothetical protein